MCLAASRRVLAEDDVTAGFLNPFPDGEVYQTSIIGDAYAPGLLRGFLEAFGGDTRLNVQKAVKDFPGVMSPEFEAKTKEFEDSSTRDPLNIAVVMFGQDDRVPLRAASSGKRIQVASKEWLEEYARRLDRVMKALKRKTPSVYWINLPILPRNEGNEQVQAMNEVIRERALVNGFKYIDAYTGFADEAGAFSAYGPGLDGKIRVLRPGNGIEFSEAGNRKLAHFIEQELRRDLNQAKANRVVPLLGNEAEQAKINPGNENKAPAPSSPAAEGQAEKTAQTAAPVVRGTKTDGTPPSQTATANGDQKADNGKITLKTAAANGREETVTLDIVRPPIPASVVALVARRESAGQAGDLLVDQIAGGLTLMSSITPSSTKARGKVAATQAPYFRLLVKGERLTPKPGRADDLSWPAKPDSSSQLPLPVPQPRG